MTATCESLVKEIVGPTGQDAADAALALGYVDDPLAEPYLRKALLAEQHLRRPFFGSSDLNAEVILLKGFARIGDARSVGVLSEVAKSGDEEMRGWARTALYEIGRRTSDPQVREEINRILATP